MDFMSWSIGPIYPLWVAVGYFSGWVICKAIGWVRYKLNPNNLYS